MSSTYYAVRKAELDAKIEAARRAGDLRAVHPLLAEKTSLHMATYGRMPFARLYEGRLRARPAQAGVLPARSAPTPGWPPWRV
jgi:hypothetical protein